MYLSIRDDRPPGGLEASMASDQNLRGRRPAWTSGDLPPSPSPPKKTSRREEGRYGGKTFKTGDAISGHGRGGDLRRLGDRGLRGGEVRDLRSPAGGVRRGDGDGRPRILPLDLRHSLRIGRG